MMMKMKMMKGVPGGFVIAVVTVVVVVVVFSRSIMIPTHHNIHALILSSSSSSSVSSKWSSSSRTPTTMITTTRGTFTRHPSPYSLSHHHDRNPISHHSKCHLPRSLLVWKFQILSRTVTSPSVSSVSSVSSVYRSRSLPVVSSSTISALSSSLSSSSTSSKHSPYEYRPNMEMWPDTTTTSTTSTTSTTTTLNSTTTHSNRLYDCFPKDTIDSLLRIASSTSATAAANAASTFTSTSTSTTNRFGTSTLLPKKKSWFSKKNIRMTTTTTLPLLFVSALLVLLLVVVVVRPGPPLHLANTIVLSRSLLQDTGVALVLIPLYATFLQRTMQYPMVPTYLMEQSFLYNNSDYNTSTNQNDIRANTSLSQPTINSIPHIVNEPMQYIHSTKWYRTLQSTGRIIHQILPIGWLFLFVLGTSPFVSLVRSGTTILTNTLLVPTTERTKMMIPLFKSVFRSVWWSSLLLLLNGSEDATSPTHSKKDHDSPPPKWALPIRGCMVPLLYALYQFYIHTQWMMTSYKMMMMTPMPFSPSNHHLHDWYATTMILLSVLLSISNMIYNSFYVFGYLLPIQMIQYMKTYFTCIVCQRVEF